MSITQQISIPEMVAQSRDIISNPSVGTFERYESRGTMVNAAIYVGIAAVVAGLLGLLSGVGGVISGILNALLVFFVFTGLVFYIGKNVANGTGTWDEVAYTFSLFWAPLAVVSAVVTFIVLLLSWVPLLNVLVGLAGFVVSLVILLVNCYFAYIAVQSSMNIRDQGKALTTLIFSFLGTVLTYWIISAIF
jgi:hypothetical protein